MFIPLIAWAIGAILSAGTTAVASTGAILATSLITIGGVSVTVGGVLAAAGAFGIATQIFKDNDSYCDEYLSEYEREFERKKLQSTLEDEIDDLKSMLKSERSSQLSSEIKDIISTAREYQGTEEYFKALHVISSFKVLYAEKKSDKSIAKSAEKVAKKLTSIRNKTHKLRGKI